MSNKIYYIGLSTYYNDPDDTVDHSVVLISHDIKKLRKYLKDLGNKVLKEGDWQVNVASTLNTLGIEGWDDKSYYYRIHEGELI